MAVSINPHYHGLVDMGRYVGPENRFLLRVTFLMPGITMAAGAFLRPCTNAEQAWGLGWMMEWKGIGWAVLPILS